MTNRTTYPVQLTMGDILDRLSILAIKQEKGLQVKQGFADFREFVLTVPEYSAYSAYRELLEVNSKLWDIENKIREAHREGNILLIARLSSDIIRYNAERARIKRGVDNDHAEPKKYHGQDS